MALWFVDDSVADNTGSGAWNDPKKTVFDDAPAGTCAADAATGGDTIYVLSTGGDTHVEVTNNNPNLLTVSGTTKTNPIYIYAVDGFNSGNPTTLAIIDDEAGTGNHALVENTGYGYHHQFQDMSFDIYGFQFKCAGDIRTYHQDHVGVLRSCRLTIDHAVGSAMGDNISRCTRVWFNVWVDWPNYGGHVAVQYANGTLEWHGGGWHTDNNQSSGGPSTNFDIGWQGTSNNYIYCIGVNLSRLRSGTTFIVGSAALVWSSGTSYVKCINCKVKPDQTTKNGSIDNESGRIFLSNTDAADDIRVESLDKRGLIAIDLATYITNSDWVDAIGHGGGANTQISYRMEPTPIVHRGRPLRPYPEDISHVVWIDTTGPKTIHLEGIHDYDVFDLEDAGIEVYYLGTAGELLASVVGYGDDLLVGGKHPAGDKAVGDWTNAPNVGVAQTVKLSRNVIVNRAGPLVVVPYLGRYELGRSFFYDPFVYVS